MGNGNDVLLSGSYDAWKLRAPEDEPGYWGDKDPDYEDEPDEPYDANKYLLELIAEASIDDPGESDLDDEQPVVLHLTLKDVRLARQVLRSFVGR